MKKYSLINTADKGFTLIEMAVVMVIVGIVISIMVTVLPSLIQTAKLKEAKAVLEKYDATLQGYAIANNRLPFADSDGDGREDTGTFTGNLPFITLGLSSGEDPWGNPVKYGVYGASGGPGILTMAFADQDAFCAAITLAGQAGFTTSEVFVTTEDSCAAADGTNSANPAFVLASGGKEDMDGVNGFFDLCTGTPGNGFNAESKRPAPDYDDITRTFSIGELNQKICSGGGGGGGGSSSTGVENTDVLCSDGLDNDGDGRIDCHDQDCCFAGATACTDCPPLDDIQITETVLGPAKSGMSGYYHLFQATGGSGAYFWSLDSISPGIPGLTIDLWSGALTGSVTNCASATPYEVTVTAEDRDNASRSDTRVFELTVDPSQVEIEPRPGGSVDPDFVVNASTFERFFTVDEVAGGHVGDFVWTIDWNGANGDPGGFQINPTSEDNRDEALNAKLWKSSAVLQSVGVYTFTLTATDSACSQNTYTSNTYSMEITEAGINPPYTEAMEAEWRFDECTAWDGISYDVVDSLDTSGDGRYFGVAAGGAGPTHAGRVCRAAVFDGNDDKIVSRVLTGDEIISFGEAVTLACWFRSPGGGGTNPRLIEFSNERGDYQWSTALAYDNDGSLRAWVTDQNSGVRAGEIDYSAERYNDNQWHHAVYAYTHADGGNLYIDGVLKTTATDDPTTDIHDAETFVIGGYYPNISHGFKGIIDEVMVFSRAFSLEEVQDLYALTRPCQGGCYTEAVAEYRMENFPWNGTSGEVKDSGTGGNDGKAAAHGAGGVMPSQTAPSSGKVCRSGVFERTDGATGGYLDMGDPPDGDLDPGTSPMTISAWVNWDGTAGENIIYNKENLYEARVNNGYVHYAWQPHWVWDGGNAFPIGPDTWTYVTVTYDGRDQILYKNGVPVFQRTQTGAMGTNSSKLLIGARGSTTPRNFFSGMIDELKIYNRVLAENEITEDMNDSRDCGADSVVITTTSLPSGTVGDSYTAPINAIGGTAPYAWEVAVNPFSGVTLSPLTGAMVTLSGTITECAGDYDITIRVTDNNSRVDERTFTLTVENGILAISPTAPQIFECTAATFYQDFTITGPTSGGLEDFDLSWNGENPGGFELHPLGGNAVRLRKISSSDINSGYLFRVTARDANCPDNVFISGTYTLNVSGEGGDTPYYYGMTGEWNMDGCTWDGTPDEVVDTSDTGAHGRSHSMNATENSQGRSTGRVCRSAAFNLGAVNNQYVTLGHEAFQNLGSFSLSLWFRLEALSATLSPLFSGASSANANTMLIYIDAAGSTIRTHLNGGQTGIFNVGSSLADGVWHHLVWTRNIGGSGTETLYIDRTAFTDTTTSTGPVSLSPGGAVIGQEQDTVGGGFVIPGESFQGWLDELKIYNRLLSQADVDNLYGLTRTCQGSCYTGAVAEYRMDESSWAADPTVYDTSGNNIHGARFGNAVINTATQHVCNNGSFPGLAESDYLRIDGLPVSGAAREKTTVCFWMNWSGKNAAMPASWGTRYDLYLVNNMFGFNTGNGDLYGVDISGGGLENTWHHVAAVFTSQPLSYGENQLYIDGLIQPCTLLLGTTSAARTVDGTLFISGWDDGTDYKYGGLIDELRVYDRALSNSEIVEDMNLSHECP